MDITNTNIVSIPNEKNKTKLLNLGKRHVPKKAKTNYIESTIESPVQNKKDTELFYFDYSGNKTREWHAEISGNKSSVLHKKVMNSPQHCHQRFLILIKCYYLFQIHTAIDMKLIMTITMIHCYVGKGKKHSYDGLNGLRNKQLKKKKWKEPIKSENNCDPKYDCKDPTIREGLKKGTEESSILLNVMDSECDMTDNCLSAEKKVDAEIEKREKLNIRKKCTKIDTIESIVKDESENLNKTKDACKYDIGIESCHKKKRKRNSRKVENQTTEAENLETSYLVNQSLEKPADDSFVNVIDLTLEKGKRKKRKNSNIFVLSDVKLDKSITTLQCGVKNQLTDDKENPNKAQDTSEYDTSIESCHKKKRKHNIRKVENQTTEAKNLETSYLVNQSLEKPADDSFVNVNDLTLEKKKNRKNSNLFVLSDVKLDKSITTLQCGVKVKENCEGEQHTDNDTPDYLKKSDSKKMLAHSNEDVIEINENVIVYNKHKKNSFNDDTANKYTLENQVSDDKEYLNKVQDTSEYDTSIESTYKKKKKRKKREAETQENRVDQSQNDKFRSYQIEEYIPSLVPNDLKIETGRTIIKHQSASENGASEIEIDDENTDNKKPRHVDCSMFNDYVNREKNTKNDIKSTPKTATNNKLSSDGTVCQNSDGVEYSSSEGYKSHSSDSELLSHSEKRSEPKKENKGGAETDENRLEDASGITSDNDSESNSSNGSKGCSDSEFLNETELDVLQLKEERYRFRHLQLVDVPFKVPILHLLTTTSTKLNAEQLTNIKNLKIEIKRGAYTKKEDNKIMENWKYFCREYGFQENPAIFIPIPRKTKMAVKLFFLRHLAHGLDDRQLYRVYIRFKVLVQQPFIKTGRYSEEEDRTIVKFLSETNSYRPFCELGEKLSEILFQFYKDTKSSHLIRR
ncbi:hypothetical protein NQ317_019930 [Molorchus minor]|uniref:Uncharacterized protein n=1 Tax=Molorchus minor TaxID=1323400 RepID=A0ABQ9K6B3_9CUCU|nr:hypothetical protein NQ317_019930 [Molorchus minor]